jgi:amidase
MVKSMPTTDFTYHTAAQLADAMAAGQISAVEVAEAAIARIERYDAEINAICVADFDRALDAARRADAARLAGDVRPLLGIPMTVKESFNVAGLQTTWGIPGFRDFVATEDAVAVKRVKDAGAVILGKTNVPLGLGDLQSYNDIHGTTNNLWDLGRTPGGPHSHPIRSTPRTRVPGLRTAAAELTGNRGGIPWNTGILPCNAGILAGGCR